MDAILQKVVFLNKKSGKFSFYSRFQLLTSRQYEKSIFQAMTIFSSISWVFKRSDLKRYFHLIEWKMHLLQDFSPLLSSFFQNLKFLRLCTKSKWMLHFLHFLTASENPRNRWKNCHCLKYRFFILSWCNLLKFGVKKQFLEKNHFL